MISIDRIWLCSYYFMLKTFPQTYHKIWKSILPSKRNYAKVKYHQGNLCRRVVLAEHFNHIEEKEIKMRVQRATYYTKLKRDTNIQLLQFINCRNGAKRECKILRASPITEKLYRAVYLLTLSMTKNSWRIIVSDGQKCSLCILGRKCVFLI